MEDRERPGAYHKIPFAEGRAIGQIEIDTTRPELLAACVALVAHPDDERFTQLLRQHGDCAALRPRSRRFGPTS